LQGKAEKLLYENGVNKPQGRSQNWRKFQNY